MNGDYVLSVDGLDGILDKASITAEIARAARMAINTTADRTRVAAANEMRRQVRFPASYLKGSNSRLAVAKRASDSDLEAIITGRHRPTSLARFVIGSPNKKGIRVQVRPGHTVLIQNAFLMKLRSGDGGPLGNVGLAVRTPSGKAPRHAYKPLKIRDGLWLLYGPDVQQVFKTVREDVTPDAEAFLASEFARLFDLKL